MPKFPLPQSPFRRHVQKWSNCTQCNLQHGRKNVVLSRGQLPCDVLFVGEAPGHSEDAQAVPFFGPAGHLLDRIIKTAEQKVGKTRRKAFTNLVGCIPLGEDGRKTDKPFPEEIKKCRPRLAEYVRIAKPRVVVRVGQLAEKWLPTQADLEPVDWLPPDQDFIEMADITHPSFIGQQNAVLQASLFKRAVLTIADAYDRLDNPLPF